MSKTRAALVAPPRGSVMSADRLADLENMVFTELTDERFTNRTHYRKATYADGCRGPMCVKRERDEARRRTQRKAEAAGRVYRPVPRSPQDIELDDWLNMRIAWHESERHNTVPVQPHCANCKCHPERIAV